MTIVINAVSVNGLVFYSGANKKLNKPGAPIQSEYLQGAIEG
jgi:hypothetical protein